jgi:hypothetical protein
MPFVMIASVSFTWGIRRDDHPRIHVFDVIGLSTMHHRIATGIGARMVGRGRHLLPTEINGAFSLRSDWRQPVVS